MGEPRHGAPGAAPRQANWLGGLAAVPERRLETLQRLALAVFAFIAFSQIISAAHLGISGHHPWRQSDVYGYILGFMHFKGFTEFDRIVVNLGKQMFEVPIYHYLIAKIALLTGSDPLATVRFFNLGCWALAAFAGYRLARFGGGKASWVAGLAFVYLFATSRLILHYYSAPIPDTMGIALALAGLVILLHYKTGWKGACWALPFLMLATFTKSPIAFVFVAFYAIYIAIDPAATPAGTGNPARRLAGRYLPFITLGIALAACAVFAEQLRVVLSDIPRRGGAFVDPPGHYFGDWRARLTADFWLTMWHRLGTIGLPGALFAAAAAAALACSRDRRFIALIAAAVGAYLLSWLVFQWRNQVHDYYQMPALSLLFIAFAAALARIAAFLQERLQERLQGKLPPRAFSWFAAAALCAAIAAAPLQAAFTKLPGARHRDNLFAGLAYAMRDQDVFLYVQNARKLRSMPPFLGGFTSTRLRYIIRADFENNCEAYLSQYPAILADGEGASTCLAENKQRARYYIEDDGFTFYLH